jgi:hypothetical protein
MAFFQPDLTWWLGIVATATLLSGLVRLALVWRAFTPGFRLER